MRILFITSTRVGDAVLSTGVLRHLIESHPEARITVACGPAAAALFEAVPGLERLIVLDKMLMSLHWLRMWAMCVGTFWGMVVDLRNAPLTYLLAARRHRHLLRTKTPGHRLLQTAAVIGLGDAPPSPGLWTLPVHDERAKNLIPDGPPMLAIGATANWRAKTWPAERFAELSRRVTAPDGLLPGGRVVLFGRAEERPDVLGLIEAIPEDRRIDLIGNVGLLDIAACLRRSALYVGNDSGLMHMAAAVGIPTLGLFGPSKEENYAPWGPLCATVRTEKGFHEIHPEGWDHRTSESLMDGLTVERVEEALGALWRRAAEAAA